MAFVKADRIQETSITTGTGNMTLAGAYDATYRTFATAMSNGDTCQYLIISESAAEWEIGEGSFVSATPALARTTVISSSNSNAAVTFSSGTKRVAMLPIASSMVVEDNSGDVTLTNDLTVPGDLDVTGDATVGGDLDVSGDLIITGNTTYNGDLDVTGALTLGTPLAVAEGGTGGTTSTGTGAVVLATSPALVTPNLGTPAAANLTNAIALPLTTGVTGTLPVGNGGTGATTLTDNGVLFGNAAAAIGATAEGATGTLLAGSTGSAPSFLTGQAAAAASGLGYSVEDLAALKALTSRPESVLVKTGQAAGVWQWVLGSSTTADDGLVVAPTSGTAGRYKRIYYGAVNVKWYNATGNSVIVEPSAVSIASAGTALTVAGATFTTSDIGKQIRVPGAGAAGALLSTTISAWTSSTQVTLAAAAGATLSAVVKPIVYGTDDTAAIQAALDASSDVFVPDGVYFTTDTLTLHTNGIFCGENPDSAIIVRTDAFSHTLQAGDDDEAAGAVTIKNIWFIEPQQYEDGVTTTLPFASTAGAAHIYIRAGQGCVIENNLLYYMPYAVVLSGTTLSEISFNKTVGIWDPTDANLQEGIAAIWLRRDAGPLTTLTKDIGIHHNQAIGGLKTASDTVSVSTTCGSENVTGLRTIGPKYGLLANDCETALIESNYFAAAAYNAIFVEVSGSIANWRVSTNFFDDGSYLDYSIRISTTAADKYAHNIAIVGNNFNGQGMGRGALYIDDANSALNAYSVTFSANVVAAYIFTPINLQGAKGVTVTGNVVTSYNWQGLCTTDPEVAAGMYIGATSEQIVSGLNTWGGGDNTMATATPPNYCSWAIYSATASYASANERAISVNTATYGGTVSTLTLESMAGVHRMGGTGVRFQADMSNGTPANRFAFQSSTTNGASRMLLVPNGTSTDATFSILNASDVANASWAHLVASSDKVRLSATKTGTGSYLPLHLQTSDADQLIIAPSGLMTALANTAVPANGSATAALILGTTGGFGIYIGSGAPSVSAAQGSLYLRTDGTTTNDRAYINSNGSTTWTALTTAA